MREKNIIQGDAFADWHAAQMTSTDRVRAHRTRIKLSRLKRSGSSPPLHEEKPK